MATCTWTNGNSTGLWSDSGNWSCAAVPGSSDDVVFDGTSTDDSDTDTTNITINSMTVASGYTGTITINNALAISVGGFSQAGGNIVINSSKQLRSSGDYRQFAFTGGSVTGDGIIYVQSDGSITISGTANVAPAEIRPQRNQTLSGTFNAPIDYNTNSGKTITFGGDVIFAKGFGEGANISPYTLNMAGHDLTIQDDADFTNADTWNNTTGTITLSGSADYNVNFDGESIADIVIDKTAGTVTLTGGVVTDSIDCQNGTLDVNGQSLETVGNFTVGAGCSVIE